MKREMILCIPGPWADRGAFLRQVVMAGAGRFIYTGVILADIRAKDNVGLEFCGPDTRMTKAFETAGQGKLPETCLAEIRGHASVVYLRAPLDLVAERERLVKFTGLLRSIGGIAVKVESAGVAHTWETWERRLKGSLFDLYCAAIVLVGDKDTFYSCGMHHFGLPECEVPSSLGGAKGADGSLAESPHRGALSKRRNKTAEIRRP